MGITKLHGRLKPLSRDVDITAYAGLAVGVDASAWLHRAYHGARAAGTYETLALAARVGLFFTDYVHALTSRNVRVVLVFDGRGPEAKKTVASARAPRPRGGCPFAFAPAAKAAAAAAGATCVQAVGEADADLAALARRGEVCCVLTDDCDLVAMGCPRCLFAAKLAAGPDGAPTLIGSEFELRALGASGAFLGWPRERFVAFCVACGCDYVKNVPGVGPVRALALSEGATGDGVLARLLAEPRCPAGYGDAFRAAVCLYTGGGLTNDALGG